MPSFPYIKTIYENDEPIAAINSQNSQPGSANIVQTTFPPHQQQQQQQQAPPQNPVNTANRYISNAVISNPTYVNNDQVQYNQVYNVQPYNSEQQVQYMAYQTIQTKPAVQPPVDNSHSAYPAYPSQNPTDYHRSNFYQQTAYPTTVYYPTQRNPSVTQAPTSYINLYSNELQHRAPMRSQTPAPIKSSSAIMNSAPQRPNSTQNHIMTRKTVSSSSVPVYRTHNGISKPVSMIDAGNNRPIRLDYSKVSQLAADISAKMLNPPFKNQKACKTAFVQEKPKRTRRKSKFTTEQDEMIVRMKNENKSWVEIAEAAKVDSYLTARNRYQVLIGQQGGCASEFTTEDLVDLKSIVDEAENEKMKHLSKEFRKCTGKLCTYKQVRELIRYLFWKDPSQFDVGPSYLKELERLQNQRETELETGEPTSENNEPVSALL